MQGRWKGKKMQKGMKSKDAVKIGELINAGIQAGINAQRDLISRQAAIDALCKSCGKKCDKSTFRYDCPPYDSIIPCKEHYALTILPSAQPERKTGKWIGEGDGYMDGGIVFDTWYCSECDFCIENTEEMALPNFCEQCGADMRGREDGKD